MRRTKKRKGIESQRVKPSTQSQAIYANIGNEEHNGKQKKNKKKKTEWVLNPPTPDHLVTSYDPHGSYSGPILKPPPAHKETK